MFVVIINQPISFHGTNKEWEIGSGRYVRHLHIRPFIFVVLINQSIDFRGTT